VKELVVTASAQLEIESAILWYDAIKLDLADDLLDKIDIGYACITAQPDAWPPYAKKYRHYILERFPYAIIYHERSEFIEVLAFAHHRRQPFYWLSSEENAD